MYSIHILYSVHMGSATGGGARAPSPQFLEKINEFLKFTIDFNNFDALAPKVLNPWRTP